MNHLERLACCVAIEAPIKPKNATSYTSIHLIKMIRQEMERRGMDWKELHREAKRIGKQREKLR